MREKIEKRVSSAIEGRVFPGCVVGVYRKGRREVFPFGHFTYDPHSSAIAEDTVYDLASITKSIPTASLALILAAEGKLRLADKVAEYIPELNNDHGATIEDLLAYRIAGPRLSALKEKTADELLSAVFERGFDGPPGRSRYTNLPALLLGLVIERVAGAPLDILSQEYFFTPLNMQHTTFFPQKYGHSMSIIAPTEIVDGQEVRGLVHDESARVFSRALRPCGHAGLFSTAGDLLNFLEALVIQTYGFTKPVIEGARRGSGWQVNEPRFMGRYADPSTFGKTGFTGTSCVCDIERGIAFVILSNRTYPKRPPDDRLIHEFRADIADIVFQSY